MNQADFYRGLNFRAHSRRIPGRALIAVGAFSGFTLMWWAVPPAVFYWLFLPILLILVWMASYGWRSAVAQLIKFLQSLEDSHGGSQ